jgi:hypothetical protein
MIKLASISNSFRITISCVYTSLTNSTLSYGPANPYKKDDAHIDVVAVPSSKWTFLKFSAHANLHCKTILGSQSLQKEN